MLNDQFRFEVCRTLFGLLLSLLMIVCAVSSPAQAKTVTVVSGAWSGLSAADGTGLFFTVLREVMAESDIELNIRVTNWKRAKQMFYANRADILLADYAGRDERRFLPQWHLLIDRPVVMFTLQPVTNLQAMKGRTVGWLLGYDFAHYLPVAVDGLEVSVEQFGFEMLQHGRLDAFISYDTSVPQTLTDVFQRYPLSPEQALYPVFQNTFAGRQLAKDFDRGMQRLHQSGRLKQLYAEWYSQTAFPPSQR